MRKGSTELGSLGVTLRKVSLTAGVALLILPLYAAATAVMIPSPTWAEEKEIPVPQPAAAEHPAIRDAVQRRSGTWLDRVNQVASGRKVLAVKRRAPKKKIAKADPKVLKVIHTRATWYGPGFHGRRTASGERFNQNDMTLASRHLPFGTRVRVTNPKTGKTVIGRVNDRGPFVRGYTADLSKGMARRIGLSSGPVRIEILGKHK